MALTMCRYRDLGLNCKDTCLFNLLFCVEGKQLEYIP